MNQLIKIVRGAVVKETYNEKGKELTSKNSDGEWHKTTYAKNGNILTCKNSKGKYLIKKERVSKEQFDVFVKIQERENFTKKGYLCKTNVSLFFCWEGGIMLLQIRQFQFGKSMKG